MEYAKNIGWGIDIWFRTICLILWQDGMLVTCIVGFLGPVLGGVVEAVFSVCMNQSNNFRLAPHVKKWKRHIAVYSLLAILIMFFTKFGYQFTAEMPSLIGQNITEAKKIMEEAGMAAVDIDFESECAEGAVIVMQLPQAGKGVARSEGRVKLVFEETGQGNDREWSSTEFSYLCVTNQENYSRIQLGKSEIMSFYYPTELFERSEPEDAAEMPEMDEYVYLNGREEGLFAWAGYAVYNNEISIDELLRKYEEQCGGDLYEKEHIEENRKGKIIFTGYKDSDRQEVVYIAMAAEDGVIRILYISFPFEGVGTEEYYSANYSQIYETYSEYEEALNEDFRRKTYFVAMMYWTCSFGDCQSMVSYDAYQVGWEIPKKQ